MCSLVVCVSASYLLISVNKPHYVVRIGDCLIYYLLNSSLRPNYQTMKSVVCIVDCLIFATEFIPHTKLSDNLICILPCGLQIWLMGKIQTNQHLESAYYPPQSANLHFTRARRGEGVSPVLRTQGVTGRDK